MLKGKETMYKIKVNNFDIKKICNSGQCFRMSEIETGIYAVVAFDSYIEISQREDELILTCTEEEFYNLWQEYLGLNDDYDSIESLIKDDSYMKDAMEYGYGIRILKQDVWETLVSFIISQQNNIPRIKKSINILCERYGEKKINFRNQEFYTFPTPEALMSVSEEELRDCNLGYRSKYILKTAAAIANDVTYLERLSQLNYEDAKKELMKLYGVGIKVSECICLYALHHMDAFPVDTHIQNVLGNYYPGGFPFEKYKGYAGPLQQYAFYYDLFNK